MDNIADVSHVSYKASIALLHVKENRSSLATSTLPSNRLLRSPQGTQERNVSQKAGVHPLQLTVPDQSDIASGSLNLTKHAPPQILDYQTALVILRNSVT